MGTTLKPLRVFDGVEIPAEYAATQTYALLARRDGGKTYTTLLLEEQLCDAGLYFVTLDPVGKHWALRAGADGAKGGKPDVWVLGGQHGDVPLEAGSGALIADTVVEHPGRYVLDVSGFESDAEQDRFALDFGKRLFRRKARHPGFPLLVILEEAESFIPERPIGPHATQLLGAYGRIIRQGRNHGLGMWMVAQRSQALNKGVLSQAEVLIVKQMAHTRDRAAVDDWIAANGTAEQRQELMGSVASLERNEAWVWSPSWLRTFTRTTVPRRVTFDSSASVKAGHSQKAIALTPLDVAALGAAIAQTAERAKAEDPKQLRAEIARLRKELAARPTETRVETVTEMVEVSVLTDEQIDALRDTVDALDTDAGRIVAVTNEISGALAKAVRGRAQQQAPPPAKRTAVPAAKPPSREPAAVADVKIGKAHRAILAVLDQRRGLVTSKRQLAVATGYAIGGGGFNNPLGALRTAGLIEGSDPIAITDTGADAIAGQYEPLPTGPALLEHWCRLGKAHGLILRELAACYPASVTKEDLAAATGYEASGGGFNNPLGKLRTLELIEGRGELRLTDAFGEEVG